MSEAEFDRHAKHYRALHRRNIAITGEETEYFADYKMADFKRLANQAGLAPDGRYLDFGSGIGTSIVPFGKRMPSAHLVCADVSQDSLALSKQRHGDYVEYAWIHGDGLPFGAAEFDGAFACCVFHHIPHDQHHRVLAELRRTLKPGGLLMIYEHNPYNPLTVRAVRNCPFDENAVLLSSVQMQRAARAAGFVLERCDYRVFFPALLALLRPLEQGLRRLPLGAQYFVALRA